MGNSRFIGTVKWFSAKKGFGFIVAKVSEGTDEQEIFVHQTSIVDADEQGFRTLSPGSVVEFLTEQGAADGKLKALQVTKPGGTPLELPPRRPRQRFTKALSTEQSMDDATNGVKTKPRQPKKKKKAPSTREPPFHQVLTESVRDKVQAKGFDLTLYGTFDIALGDARIKLGLGQYAGLAHKDGIIAEGSYGCDEEGTVTFAWKSAICFQEGTWKPYNIENIVKSISLAKDNAVPVSSDETPESLWGSDKTDPKEALESNGFLMRRVVLSRPSRQPKTDAA